MNLNIDECLDGHRCENGSVCVENPFDEGNFYCDCDTADFNSVYEGLYCEHQATEFCSNDGGLSRTSFCTNQGKCKAIVGPDDGHPGCHCAKGYEGDHCQFVQGTQPEQWPTNSVASAISQGSKDPKIGQIFFFSVMGLVLIVLIIAFLARQRNSKAATPNQSTDAIENAEIDKPTKQIPNDDELTLEMDGSVITDFAAGSSLPSPEDMKKKKNTVEIVIDDGAEVI